MSSPLSDARMNCARVWISRTCSVTSGSVRMRCLDGSGTKPVIQHADASGVRARSHMGLLAGSDPRLSYPRAYIVKTIARLARSQTFTSFLLSSRFTRRSRTASSCGPSRSAPSSSDVAEARASWRDCSLSRSQLVVGLGRAVVVLLLGGAGGAAARGKYYSSVLTTPVPSSRRPQHRGLVWTRGLLGTDPPTFSLGDSDSLIAKASQLRNYSGTVILLLMI